MTFTIGFLGFGLAWLDGVCRDRLRYTVRPLPLILKFEHPRCWIGQQYRRILQRCVAPFVDCLPCLGHNRLHERLWRWVLWRKNKKAV